MSESLADQLLPLQRVEIQNFRGIREMTLELHPRVTVLFAENAAGKTTVLEAIRRLFLSRRGSKRGSIGGSVLGGEVVPFGAGRVTTRVEAVLSSGKSLSVSRTATPSIEVGEHESWPALHRSEGPVSLVAVYFAARSAAVSPWESPKTSDSFDLAARYREEMRQSLALNTSRPFENVFPWFLEQEDAERRAKLEMRDFEHRIASLEWVRRAIEATIPGCSNLRTELDPLRLVVDVKNGSGQSERLDLNQLSDGFRTHLGLVVDVARRMVQVNPTDDFNDQDRATNARALVLIDEIDLHLHPKWQGTVIPALLKAFPKTQFIVTTHSEQVIASVKKESVRELFWEEGAIQVRNVDFANGSSSERVLTGLMDVPKRVPGEVLTKLTAYQRLVAGGEGRTPDALAKREELDALIPDDVALLDADLEMRRLDRVSAAKGKS